MVLRFKDQKNADFSFISESLGLDGISLYEKRNIASAQIVSTENGKTIVCVIHTDEEWMIAKTVNQIIKPNKKTRHDNENKKSV
jgi:acetate kinase